jgi:hypothetical protein
MEHLLVIISGDIIPQIAQESTVRHGDVEVGDGVQSEGGREIDFEE